MQASSDRGPEDLDAGHAWQDHDMRARDDFAPWCIIRWRAQLVRWDVTLPVLLYSRHRVRIPLLTSFFFFFLPLSCIDRSINDTISTTTTTMSCDFGPIPSPPPPLQTYWEGQFSRGSTANQSRSAPVTKPEKNNIAPQLYEALEKLAEEQQRQDAEKERDYLEVPQRRSDGGRKAASTHKRGQSFGQRLLSGSMEWWSKLSEEQQPAAVQKVSLAKHRCVPMSKMLTIGADEAVMSVASPAG